MRQAGIIAAAALYAVENNIPRLAEDHEKAKMLAETIAGCAAFDLDLSAVHTNIVIWKVNQVDGLNAGKVMDMLKEKGVLVIDIGGNRIRAVCHLDVSKEEIITASEIIKKIFG